MPARRSNPDFLNGVPELLALQLLSQREMHGYELVQQIRATTQDALQFGEGSIYPVLHRLEAEGKLSSRQIDVGGRARIVYRVTRKGAQQLSTARSTWERVVSAVQSIVQGGTHEQPSVA